VKQLSREYGTSQLLFPTFERHFWGQTKKVTSHHIIDIALREPFGPIVGLTRSLRTIIEAIIRETV